MANIIGGLCNSGDDVFVGLSLLGQWGPVKVGEINRLLLAVPIASASGPRPSAKPENELLPISPLLARQFLTREFCLSRDPVILRSLEVCLGTLAGLNCLYSVGMGENPVLPNIFGELSDAQKHSLYHIFHSCIESVCASGAPFSLQEHQRSLLEMRFTYSGDMVSVRRDLVASKVIAAWPAIGAACVCPIIEYVDEHLRDEMLNPLACLLPESEWPVQTPRSKVHATVGEWHAICKAAVARNMFCQIPESELFKNQFGDFVLNGAMGVDKFKEINGKMEHQLRFISILTPLNCYSRKFQGDSWLLPQASFLSHVVLGEDEFAWTDGEDLQSCFNLFYMPDAWRGLFAFSKQVSSAIFGGPPGELSYVGIRAVPMGWTNSVDVIQNFIRRFVFQICKVPGNLEVRKDRPIPPGDVAVVCMDGFDLISKVQATHNTLKSVHKLLETDQAGRSPEMARFIFECERRNLPLNTGKEVIASFSAGILGGEFEGVHGVMRHARDKGEMFLGKSLALLSLSDVPQVSLQHWSGLFCFMAAFRRPLFTIVQEIFPLIISFSEDPRERRNLPGDVANEVLISALLAPLAFCNLRAQIRLRISISDASEEGGAAAEAANCLPYLHPHEGNLTEELLIRCTETSVDKVLSVNSEFCSVCGCDEPRYHAWGRCGVGCSYIFCSWRCWHHCGNHVCPRASTSDKKVAVHFCESQPEVCWNLFCAGLSPLASVAPPGLEAFSPEAAVHLVILPDFSFTGYLGHRTVRDVARPLGFPKLAQDHWTVRQDNKLAHRFVDLFGKILDNGSLFIFVHPWNSFIWEFPDWITFLVRPTVFCNQVEVVFGSTNFSFGVVHNSPLLHKLFNSVTSFTEPANHFAFPWKFLDALSVAVLSFFESWDAARLPLCPSDRLGWVLQSLRSSTRGLSRVGLSSEASDRILNWVSEMIPGSEKKHLINLLNDVDFKGSDVRLESGTLLEGARQPVPYPAIAWQWTCVQAYSWKQKQHINVLELIAFFNFLRHLARSKLEHSARFFHILDSRVSSCVLAKGRSSSKILNRSLRRITSLLLASDLYVLPLWTISSWNFSDAGSRCHNGPVLQRYAG
jgi:hypothetical protein